MEELTMSLARILGSLDVKTAEGEAGRLGEGGTETVPRGERKGEYQLKGGFIAGKDGPMVQFRRSHVA
jgi:hypothetical protein